MSKIYIQPILEIYGRMASYRLRVYDHDIDRESDLATLPDFIGIGDIDIVRGMAFADGFLFKKGFKENLLEVYQVIDQLGGHSVIFESHIKGEVVERVRNVKKMIERLSK